VLFYVDDNVARTVCRRTERNLVGLYKQDEIEGSAYKYVNRLSDYLFTYARLCALTEGKEETIYKKAKKVEV
jgi:cob(I)alamin adenosyltransferase